MTVAARFRATAARPRRLAILLAPLLALAALISPLAASRPLALSEVRALWVTRGALRSPGSVAEMVRQAQAAGFNSLLVQVRGRGDAYFNDGIEPRAATLSRQPESFDPLATVLKLAHERNLRVHAWVNVGLVSSAVELPASRMHLVYRHPEWLMVPRALAREMALLEPKSQLYLDKLTRWTRTQTGEVEGLYLSPVPADAAATTLSVVADIVARYPVDGVHLDYLRYPNDQFDYSRAALVAFREDILSGLSEAEARRRQRTIGDDLVGWTETFPEQWAQYRRERLTALVSHVRESIKARRPGIVLSAAVYPDPAEAASYRLQDWNQWIRLRLLDVVCPMAYATDAAGFASQIAGARQSAGTLPLWAGIGAYRLSTTQTIDNIRTARRLGASGIVLFSYDSLAGVQRGRDLSQIGRVAFKR